MLRWLRNYARAKTLFIDPTYAAATKKKLAICYAIIAYNMFGIIVYNMFKKNVPRTEDSIDYAKMYGLKNAKVFKLSGISQIEQYDINLSDKELMEFKEVIGTEEEKQAYDDKNEERRRLAKEAQKQ